MMQGYFVGVVVVIFLTVDSANLLKLLSRYYRIFLHTSTIIDASLACTLDIKRVPRGGRW